MDYKEFTLIFFVGQLAQVITPDNPSFAKRLVQAVYTSILFYLIGAYL